MDENRCSNCVKSIEKHIRLHGYENLNGIKFCYEEQICGDNLFCKNFIPIDDGKAYTGLTTEED